MSFLGGAECSTAGNPLSQFTKHVQDDKSLQRDRLVGRGPAGLQESMRSQAVGPGQDQMMNEFLQHPGQIPQGPGPASPFAMEQMRRELERVSHRTPSPGAWAAEFDPGMEAPSMEARLQQPGFNPAEFQKFQMASNSAARAASPVVNNAPGMMGYQRPMGFGMGMGGMGMGMNYTPPYMQQNAPQQPEQMEGKGKGRLVELDDTDWEAQFAQMETDQSKLDALDAEANAAMEKELNDIDRQIADEENYLHMGEGDQWEGFDELSTLGAAMRDPKLGDYMFEQDNLFRDVTNPYEEGVRIMEEGGNLSLAALAFEAAVQKDPLHVDAWARLGEAQAQNEKESPAIRALEQALKVDPNNLEVLMGLAVSYTNEGYDSTAYRTLERWLATKYPSLITEPLSNAEELGFTDRHELHKKVTDLFIKAAQLSPMGEQMDPDVQVGLGVLFYGAEE